MKLATLYPRFPREHLAKLISLESQDLFTVFAFALAAGLMALATPVAVQALVNTIAFGVLLQPLVVLMFTLLGCLALSSLLNGLQIFVVEIIQRRIFVRLVSQISRKLIEVKFDQPILRKGSEIANYYFEVMTIQKTWSNLLLDGLAYGLQTLIGLILLAFYHPALLAFDVMIMLSLYLIFRVLGKNGVKTAVAESEAKYAVAAWLQALAQKPLLMKWDQAGAFVWNQSNLLTETYLDRSHDHFKVVMKQQAAILALYALANSALLGLGGWMVIERQLTLGQLVAAELIVSAMFSGLTRLGKSITSYYDLMAGMDKLSYLLDLPAESSGGEHLAQFEDHLNIRVNRMVLQENGAGSGSRFCLPDFDVSQGDKLLIYGPSKALMQQLLEMIGGLSPLPPGSVLINGIDSSVLQTASIRDRWSMVLKPEWFQDSILDNMCLGRSSIGLEQVHGVLKVVGLDSRVHQLPEGLRTCLEPSGAPLEEIELFLLSLARAMAGKPQLLIVGSFIESLDEKQLQGVLDILLDAGASWSLILGTSSERVVDAAKTRVKVLRLDKLHDSEA